MAIRLAPNRTPIRTLIRIATHASVQKVVTCSR
jgi:hypothetical protein